MKLTFAASLLAASFAGGIAQNMPNGHPNPPVGPPDHANPSVRARKIFDYWTSDRKNNAIPMSMEIIDDGTGERRQRNLIRKGGRKLQLVDDGDWNDGGAVNEAAGRLFFKKGTANYVCSASVIDDGATAGRSLLATAGHCVYDSTSTGDSSFHTDFLFIPGQDDGQNDRSDHTCSNDPYGCWAPSAAIIDKEWKDRVWSSNIPWDYAILAVPDSGAWTPGYINDSNGSPALDTVVPALQVDFHNSQGLADGSISTFMGYSYNHDPNFRYCRQELDSQNDRWVIPGCLLSGGASGGPCLPIPGSDGKLNSVVSYSYAACSGCPQLGMGGARLNDNSFSCLYTRAKDASLVANLVVDYAADHGSNPCDVSSPCTPSFCNAPTNIQCGTSSGVDDCGNICSYNSTNTCRLGEDCVNNVCELPVDPCSSCLTGEACNNGVCQCSSKTGGGTCKRTAGCKWRKGFCIPK